MKVAVEMMVVPDAVEDSHPCEKYLGASDNVQGVREKRGTPLGFGWV